MKWETVPVPSATVIASSSFACAHHPVNRIDGPTPDAPLDAAPSNRRLSTMYNRNAAKGRRR